MIRWVAGSLLALGLLVFAAAPAQAQNAVHAISPVEHAARVEQRALKSSFPELEAFGQAAARRNDAEGLSRLQHVTWIMINQDDFPAAERWNTTLRRSAQRQNSARYLAIAQVNEQQIRHFRDGEVTVAEAEALAAVQTDWLAKVVAQTGVARLLIDDERNGDAIRLMALTIPLIPKGQSGEASVAAAAWDRVSIAHMMVDDVPGYLAAISKAEAYMAASDYPRPDYESIYNLAQSLGFLGRYDEAASLVRTYSQLAARTNTPTSRALSGILCAYAASTRDDQAGVLDCLKPFGPDLNAPEPIASTMMSFRAAAFARTGQIALAQRDLTEIDRRIGADEMSESGTVRRARIELMLAKGEYATAIPALREYHLSRYLRASKAAAAAMEQIVVGIDDQLKAANTQNALKARVINTQRWMVLLLVVLGTGLAAMFWRQSLFARKLAEANRREREAHEAKSAFFANMSHEIRTPLNGVVAMADALGQLGLKDDAAHMVRIIASSSYTLERLLTDILDEAKMEAGQIEIETLPFNLGETVDDIQALWAQRASAKNVLIEAHVDDRARRWAMGDRVRLTQVLNNLVSNALKFTSEGKVVLSATTTHDDRVLFAVTDTGVGFDATQKAKIFERFQQADGTIARRFGGTGLGLSICRQLAELMGGNLDCDSKPGAGSRFWFEIELPTAAAVEQPVAVPATEVEADRAQIKILVADDHPANRSIMGMLLDGENMVVDYAVDGQEAVEAVRKTVFDVILMDMQMPVMGGLDATRAIREFEAEAGRVPTTIVILSANADKEHQRQGADAGANGYISKPVILERLLEGIDLAIKQNENSASKSAPSYPAPSRADAQATPTRH